MSLEERLLHSDINEGGEAIATDLQSKRVADLSNSYDSVMIRWGGNNTLKALFSLKVIACLAISIPDAVTYHAYALENANIVNETLFNYTEVLADITYNWIQYCAPTGVYLFALNNLLRWFSMFNESIMMFKHYNKLAVRWIVYSVTAILAGVSVIPFYGMSKSAGLSEFFAVANSIARFCMDHYSWYAICSVLIDKKIRPKWKHVPGIFAFSLGALTATYLYPFAEVVSNPTLAVFGVVPTCILWGLDSRFSWEKIVSYATNLICNAKKTCKDENHYDPDLQAWMIICLSLLFLVVSAGALSETMTATNSASVIGYPSLFMTIVAGIAFTGIYFSGPTQITGNVFQFLQLHKNTEKQSKLFSKVETNRYKYFLAKLKDSKVSPVINHEFRTI